MDRHNDESIRKTFAEAFHKHTWNNLGNDGLGHIKTQYPPPATSASVNPICKPALSNPSCNGRGANISRAFAISFILTKMM